MRCKRVLIADDHREGADVLSSLISQWGHDVLVAYSGLEAVRAARTFLPDVVILDIDMPRMDGFEAACALRNRETGAVIVALTGLPPALLPERMLEDYFDEHYAKPMRLEQLQGLLNGD